jgi:hypothetical protein
VASLNIFESDAFSTASLLAAIENLPYKPQFIGSLDLFDDDPQRLRDVMVESRDNELNLIPITPVGAPLPQLDPDIRGMRIFRTPRIAKGSTLYAETLQGIRAFGSETELAQVQVEVARRLARLQGDVELTWEHMRLGALQGYLLDADGSIVYNYFTAFDIAVPTPVVIDFANLNSGELRALIEGSIIRPMVRGSKGAITIGARIVALVGDAFWDAMMQNAEIRQSYLNYSAAADLRGATLYKPFQFAGVEWVNYRGTDDNSTVAIATDEAKFFPVGAQGVFKVAWGPGEFMDTVNQPGVPLRPLTLPDPTGREAYVIVEVYSYPLFICTKPQVLRTAQLPT